MRPIPALALAVLSALPVLASGDGLSPGTALAAGGGGVRMEVLVDGRVAREYAGRGKTYVQAFKGKEYSIRLSNDSPERVAVALAVDGLNSIDAKRTSAAEATKWVLGPWEQVVIDGWQVGPDHARHFVFTSEESSYGAWLGETRNLGIISAAFFREYYRTPCCDDPVPYTSGGSWDGDYDGRLGEAERAGSDDRRAREEAQDSSVMAESAPRSAPSGSAGAGRSSSTAADSGWYGGKTEKKDDRAATGSGRRVQHSVEWVPFDLDPSSATTIDLRYGFHDELVELGILPRPRIDTSLPRRETATGFAPDPGSACCR